MNCWLWVTKYRGTWIKISVSMDFTRHQTYCIDDVGRLLSAFNWTADKYGDWFPWVHTIYANHFNGDCDNAAVYGGFLLSCIGIKSRRVKLISTNNDSWNIFGWYGHIVQISNDNKYMVSNNDLVEITGEWKQFVKDYFYSRGLDNYDWIL
jgi:hypothetical protein